MYCRPDKQLVAGPTTRNTKLNTNLNTPLPDDLDCPRFREAWADWFEYRKSKRKPVSELAAKRQLKKLAAVGVEAAVAALDTSISNDWIGVFPERAKATSNGRMHFTGIKEFLANDKR